VPQKEEVKESYFDNSLNNFNHDYNTLTAEICPNDCIDCRNIFRREMADIIAQEREAEMKRTGIFIKTNKIFYFM